VINLSPALKQIDPKTEAKRTDTVRNDAANMLFELGERLVKEDRIDGIIGSKIHANKDEVNVNYKIRGADSTIKVVIKVQEFPDGKFSYNLVKPTHQSKTGMSEEATSSFGKGGDADVIYRDIVDHIRDAQTRSQAQNYSSSRYPLPRLRGERPKTATTTP